MNTNHRIIHVAKMTSAAGAENHLLALLPGLHDRGLDVRLVILVEPAKPMDEYAAKMTALGVPTEQITIHKDFDPAMIDTLAAHFRDNQVEAVHTHLIHADYHGLIAARRAGITRIYSSGHNDDRFRHLLPIRLVQGWFWRQVTGGIAISEALREFMIKVEFAPPAKISTVHYGLDATSIPIDPLARESLHEALGLPIQTPIAGSVCRLVDQKGLIYALQALAEVALPDLHYVIAGDGPLRESLCAEAETLGIKDRVHFLGWHANGRGLMQGFDALIMPSLWEGFGLVALEAMAAGIPVIASRVSALAEIVVDGKTGYLTVAKDVPSLVTAITKTFSDLDHARMMGQQGRTRLDSVFSVAQMVEKTIAVYER